MTFKEFISALFEKWACKHDWEEKSVMEVTEDFGGIMQFGEERKYKFCKKCGKFKKIRSY